MPARPSWHWLSALLFTGLAVAIVLTFRDYGISWDEPVQNTYGNDLLDFYTSEFRDRDALAYMNLFFYGGFFDLVAALLNRISPFGVYETRHLWGAVFALIGLAGAWRLADLLAGARAGFIAVALLGIQALMFGHGFINPKDAPLAWLLLWVIYFAARAIMEPAPRTSTLIGFALSVGLALGTRIMAAPVFGYIAGGLILGAVAHRYRPTAPPMGRATRGLLAALPLAYAVMAVCWPWSIQRPQNPVLALHEFTNFPWAGKILWNGHMVPSAALPRMYLMVLLWFQLPEHLLLGLLFVAVASVLALARYRLDLLLDRRCVPILIIMASALGPLAGFVIFRPTIYNGLRHFLFVIPPLGVLAALGWNAALDALARCGRLLATGGVIVLLGLCGLQVRTMVRLHPYEYIAYNSLLGGVAGAEGRFELDYWDVSFKEAAEKLAALLQKRGETSPTFYVCGNRLSAEAFLPRTARNTYRVEEADYLISDVPSPCGYLADVTRDHVVEIRRDGALLSYVVDLRPQRRESSSH